MKHFCIIANQAKDETPEYVEKIRKYLVEHGCTAFVTEPILSHVWWYGDREIPENTECALVLGGDGTLIHAAKALMARKIPVFGLNFGTLGFLTGCEPEAWEQALQCLMSDNYRVDECMALTVSKDGKVSPYESMNDVVITRSGFSRVIQLDVKVDGMSVCSFSGDGVIVSTPTGSTGYSLSAGGPLVSPRVKAILITPICPHGLSNRPIAVPDDAEIDIHINRSTRSRKNEAVVTLDGDELETLAPEETIHVSMSENRVWLVRLPDHSFWDTVKRKL